MKLMVYNGSPRKESSNTKMLLDSFLKGFMRGRGNSYQILYIAGENRMSHLAEILAGSETALIAFPLYIDCMPAVTMSFFESLEPYIGFMKNTRLCFLVQSGFPEPLHSRPVERYLEKLTKRLGAQYIGAIIRGGVRSASRGGCSRKLSVRFELLGESFGKTGTFDSELVKGLAPRDRLSSPVLQTVNLLDKIGFLDRMWEKSLKENGGFSKRYDRPYL